MEDLKNKLTLIAGGRKPKPPPTPHDPYETPEGALYIGYLPLGKESLYTEEELDMFKKLEGGYVGLPAGDPYQSNPTVPLEPLLSSNDPSARNIFEGDYELGRINIATAGQKPADFNDFYIADRLNRETSKIDAGHNNVDQTVFGQGGSSFAPVGGRGIQLVLRGPTNSAKRSVSVTEIKTLDLIGEGEIEGLSSGEYFFTPKALGQIGYQSAEFKLNPNVALNGQSYKYLQSIYYNAIPIVDQEGRFNFQQVSVNSTPGLPNPGIGIEDITNEPLQVVRRVGERIRGPNTRNGSLSDEKESYYFSKFYKILNKSCDSIKLLIRLDSATETIQDLSKRYEPVNKGKGYGDSIPIQIGFEVSFRRIFANSKPDYFSLPFRFSIVAKLTNGFIYEYRLPFFKTKKDLENNDFQGYEIKVTRLTPDSTEKAKANRSTIDSIIEVYSQKFTYPNSAIISCKFSADLFTNIPQRTFDVRLLKVKIPSNYDPILKTYSGDWDGSFKENKFWTDNPAWCYYDLLTNKRYGLGKYIKEEDVDKWSMYELSQYCDEMVSDLEGGVEPRYTINAYFSDRSDAFDALKSFSSIFRGLTYFMAGSIFCTYDSAKNPIYTFTNSNIKDGTFSYQGSSSQSRGNVFLVRYNDKNNFYEPAIEYVEDALSIKRNGVIEKQIGAFGCVKKSYAIRYAEWMKQTENTEVETVSFSAGLEGMLLKPGDVINVQDRSRSSRRLGGRIFNLINSVSLNESSLTLDSKILFSGEVNYNLSLITPTYNLDSSLITTGTVGGMSSNEISGIRRPHIQKKVFTNNDVSYVTGEDGEARTKIAFTSSFDQANYLISGRNVFSITSTGEIDSNPPKAFRIINIKEDKTNEYSISAMEFNLEKYNLIDSGIVIDDVSLQPPPKPLTIDLVTSTLSLGLPGGDQIDVGIIKCTINPPIDQSNLNGYALYAKQGDWSNADFSEVGEVTVSNKVPDNKYLIESFAITEEQKDNPQIRSFSPTNDGTYYFRAYSKNKRDVLSTIPASGEIAFSDFRESITFFSISSLTYKDDVFFSYATGGAILGVSTRQRNADITGNVGSAKKLAKGPNYVDLYTHEILTLEKEPTLTWQFGAPPPTDPLEHVKIESRGISFRITAREPSPTSLPSKFIYFEITGHSSSARNDGSVATNNEITISFDLNKTGIVRDSSFSRTQGQYPAVASYKFPTTQQIQSNPAYYSEFSGDYFEGNAGPFRNYDVVIEAVDKNGNSSVGYSILGAEKILNNKWNSAALSNINRGYDILEIRNPKPAQTICTPTFRFDQAKASIPNSDDANPIKKNSFFNIYNPSATAHPIYKVSDQLYENYPTIVALGAANSSPTFCVTQQYFTLDGQLFLLIKRDSRGFVNSTDMVDYRDAKIGIVYFSDTWFNSDNLKNLTWSKDPFDADLFKSNEYTERNANVSQLSGTTRVLDNTNSTTFTASVKAKIHRLAENTPFVENGQFEFKMDINTKKYVSFAFLDDIDSSNPGLTAADDEGKFIIENSKNYNKSPAALVFLKGFNDTSAKSGFRAYVKASIFYSTGGIYRAKFVDVRAALNNVGDTVLKHFPAKAEYRYNVLSVNVELFCFGVNPEFSSVTISTYNDAVALIFVFPLLESVPVKGRIYFTHGAIKDSKIGLTEKTFCFVFPIEKSYFVSKRTDNTMMGDVQFAERIPVFSFGFATQDGAIAISQGNFAGAKPGYTNVLKEYTQPTLEFSKDGFITAPEYVKNPDVGPGGFNNGQADWRAPSVFYGLMGQGPMGVGEVGGSSMSMWLGGQGQIIDISTLREASREDPLANRGRAFVNDGETPNNKIVECGIGMISNGDREGVLFKAK